MTSITLDEHTDPQSIKRASHAALASILNLTFLPGFAFIWLILANKKNEKGTIDSYHVNLGIKLNLWAGAALILVSGLMVVLGGFASAWTWVYVITYFTFVHTTFIVIAIWALTRAWSGLKLTNKS
jgi:hypothetical protein